MITLLMKGGRGKGKGWGRAAGGTGRECCSCFQSKSNQESSTGMLIHHPRSLVPPPPPPPPHTHKRKQTRTQACTHVPVCLLVLWAPSKSDQRGAITGDDADAVGLLQAQEGQEHSCRVISHTHTPWHGSHTPGHTPQVTHHTGHTHQVTQHRPHHTGHTHQQNRRSHQP